jgi:hypothetical protein
MLVRLRAEEFAELLDQARIEVADEDAQLRSLADAEGVIVTGDQRVWRLRPGPASDDELIERISTNVGGCPSCQKAHVAGHRCEECGGLSATA